MTIRDLKDYRVIAAELQNKKQELKRCYAADVVVGSANEFPYTKHSISVEGVKSDEISEALQREILELRKLKREIEDFVFGIDDRLTKNAILYRYILGSNKKSWTEVAFMCGGGNSADNVRMAVKNYLKKELS